MKALPFPCIRPAQDRVIEAMTSAGTTLSSNDALRSSIAEGLMLKDPGAAYYVYECSGAAGSMTGVVAICPIGVLGSGVEPAGEDSEDEDGTGTAITELKVQPRPVSLTYDASPVMDIILGAAKEGATLYAVTDPTGTTHRVWEVKREDAVGAIKAMLEQAPEPAAAGDDAYAAALQAAAEQLIDEAKKNGSLTGREPFNYVLSALFPSAQVVGAAPQMPAGMLTHQVARF